jgi:Flp pilus assembly protein CpaB
MRLNRSIRIGIALIAGAFVLLLLYLVVSNRSSTQVANTPPNGVQPVVLHTQQVAYALEDIPERAILTPNMFRMEQLPEDAPRADYISDPQSQAIGFITRRRILRNSRIRMSDLVGHISDVGIAGALRPGTVAMIVPLANKPTFHDLVRVGDTVDIIAAFEQQESRTIVENVRVLAVDVFGKDYPQTSVAMRGDYKAPPRTIRTDNPPSPPGNNVSGPTNAAAPANTTNNAAGEAAPAPAPAPTPTPTPGPTARPAPALTVEVTPEQANRISLAQNASAAIDFVIRPHEVPIVLPGGEVRVAAVIKPQIAPYAERKKNQPAVTPEERQMKMLTKAIVVASRPSNTKGSQDYVPPSGFPNPAPGPGMGTPPMTITGTVEADTYAIPVYVDGKRVRTDIVRKPRDGS